MGKAAPGRSPDTQLFRDAFQASPIGIVVGTIEGQPLFVNPAFCSFLGFSEEELRNKHCVDFSPPEDAEKDSSLFQRLRAGSIDHYQLEKRYFRQDGSLAWGRLSLSLLNRHPSPLVIAMVEDITDKKRAEEVLRESESRFRFVADTAPVMIWMSGVDKLCTYFNKTWLDFTGRSIEQELGNRWAEGVNKDDIQRCLETYTQSFDRREKFQMEYRLRRYDGEYRWIFDIGVPRYGQEGSFAGYIGSCIDVTERKRAEEARFKHAAVVESSEDAIISQNLDKIIVCWNEGAQHLFGYTEAEAVGQPITIIIPPELHNEENKILDRLRVGGRIEHYETIHVTKTGKRVDVSLNIGPVKDSSGKVVGFSKIAHDISKRKMAEQALRESEQRLRLAQWAARIGTFDLNMRTGVDIWTPEMEALYGLPPGGFGGTLAAFENLVHPDDRKRIIALTDEMIRTGQPAEAEWRVVWPDGSVRWIAGRGQVLRDESGEPSRMIGVNMDITESKRAEKALHDVNRALQEQSALLQSREELLEIFVKNVPAPVAMLDREMRYVQVSERWCTDYLQGRAQIIGRSHYEVFPDVPERWKEVHRRALQGETVRADEDRWDGQDGPHWARWEVRPWKTPEGIVGGILVLTEDITRRKQLEEVLTQFSRKLIESQEQDRSRIGRDLHDDINQQLALLAIDIEQLKQHPPDSAGEISGGLTAIIGRINAIAADVQSISHQLHSPQLEILGIVGAIRGFCREFAARQKVTVDFTHNNIPKGISHEVSLCLFRVLQEALHNAVKHSNVRHYQVNLGCSASVLHLTVSDRGTGFNAEVAMSSGGLGLVSMRERVRLVSGTIVVKSTPMGGTIVHVHVPLISEHHPQQSAS